MFTDFSFLFFVKILDVYKPEPVYFQFLWIDIQLCCKSNAYRIQKSIHVTCGEVNAILNNLSPSDYFTYYKV
jgi:hypothetical protein